MSQQGFRAESKRILGNGFKGSLSPLKLSTSFDEPGHFLGEKAWNFHWLLKVSVGPQGLGGRESWAQLFPRGKEQGLRP